MELINEIKKVYINSLGKPSAYHLRKVELLKTKELWERVLKATNFLPLGTAPSIRIYSILAGKTNIKCKFDECSKNCTFNANIQKWGSYCVDHALCNEERAAKIKASHARRSPKDRREFITINHLQGDANAIVAYALMYDGEIVSVMSFRKSRFDINYDWELIRFATKLNTVVVGGMSKLIAAFQREYNGSILSYANRRWSNGRAYESVGFKKIRATGPNYFYVDKHCNLHTRYKFQKKNLSLLLEHFNPDLTEWENMQMNGWNRIWDSGNIVYVLD